MRAHLWGNSAVLHWKCYIALLRSEGAPGAEEARGRATVTNTRPSKALLEVRAVAQAHAA
jgi:hypothetical protein